MFAVELIELRRIMNRVRREIIVVVVRVNIAGNNDLVKIALALRQFCLPLGGCQGRQQERREDGDDGDDDQEFNEGKTTSRSPSVIWIDDVHTQF